MNDNFIQLLVSFVFLLYFSGFTNWIIQFRCHWSTETPAQYYYHCTLFFFRFSCCFSSPQILPFSIFFYSSSSLNTNSISTPKKQHSWTKKASQNLIIPQNLFQCCFSCVHRNCVPVFGYCLACCKIEKEKKKEREQNIPTKIYFPWDKKKFN